MIYPNKSGDLGNSRYYAKHIPKREEVGEPGFIIDDSLACLLFDIGLNEEREEGD